MDEVIKALELSAVTLKQAQERIAELEAELAKERDLGDRVAVYAECMASCAIVALDDDECTCGHHETRSDYRKARGL